MILPFDRLLAVFLLLLAVDGRPNAEGEMGATAEEPAASTALPIFCLMEWDTPKCREHAFNVPAPKFAPNFRFPKPPAQLGASTRDKDGFFTPVLPKALDPAAQQTAERNRVRHSKTTHQAEAAPTAAEARAPPSAPPTSTSVRTSPTTPPTAASTFRRRTAAPITTSPPTAAAAVRSTTRGTTRTAEREDADAEDYGGGEEGGEDYGAEDEEENPNGRPSPATYAPYARARLVNSGPNELDGLWTDLKEAVEFKPGAAWRRPTTTTTTTQRTRPPTTTTVRPPPTTTTTRTAWITQKIATSLLATTSQLLTSTTDRPPLQALENTPAGPLPAVRPTTPFSPDTIMTTTKASATAAEFPKTALISIASLSVIIIIGVVIFVVFKCCRSTVALHDGAYPMVHQGGKAAGISSMTGGALGGGAHGYTPIPSEMSPPAAHTAQFATMATRHPGYDSMNGASTLPAVIRRQPGGLPNGGGAGGVSTNGYQPLAGQVIVNANGQSSPARANGHANGAAANGGSRTLGPSARKKDFKEWYV